MEKISIVGSGNVGANTAFFMAEKGITHVYLHDIREGLSIGKSLDMMEAAPIRKYRNTITGLDNIDQISDSQAVVIAAGSPRSPGMRREELLKANIPVIESVGAKIKDIVPDSIVIMATEPVDLLTAYFIRKFGYNRQKVIGVGGILDAARLKYYIARETSVSAENIAAMVIGTHNDRMIILPQYTRVSGIPITQLLEAEQIKTITAEVKSAGNLILELAQRSSAYYAPSAAVAELADAIHMDLRRILPVSVLLEGEYGIEGAALSLPCIIGRNGIARVLTPKLNEAELDVLKQSAAEIKQILKEAGL